MQNASGTPPASTAHPAHAPQEDSGIPRTSRPSSGSAGRGSIRRPRPACSRSSGCPAAHCSGSTRKVALLRARRLEARRGDPLPWPLETLSDRSGTYPCSLPGVGGRLRWRPIMADTFFKAGNVQRLQGPERAVALHGPRREHEDRGATAQCRSAGAGESDPPGLEKPVAENVEVTFGDLLTGSSNGASPRRGPSPGAAAPFAATS